MGCDRACRVHRTSRVQSIRPSRTPTLLAPLVTSESSYQSARLRVAVIGGGFAGLAAAHKLGELDPAMEVTLFEAGDTLAGVVRTELSVCYLHDLSAHRFITTLPRTTHLFL